MILFKDLLEQLETAEVSLIALTDKATGVILPEKFNKVIGFLNTALSDLFVRFEMQKGECVIQTTEGKYSYEINKTNALTENPTNGFIQDTPSEPFTHTVLELIGVYTMMGRSLPFNVMESFDHTQYNQQQTFSADECVKVFSSPKYAVLRTPVGLKDSLLKVRYKVGHTPIKRIQSADLPTFDPESLAIDLPYSFMMALVYFIASRANAGKGTERAGNTVMNESGTYYGKYLSECKVLQNAMSQSAETTTPVDTFYQRGFI